MGWFKKFISFLADGFAKFMDIFASVSEAVVEFAIAPVLTLLIGLFWDCSERVSLPCS